MNNLSIYFKGEKLSGCTAEPKKYSTEETVIGTWFDSPLYERSVQMEVSSTDTVLFLFEEPVRMIHIDGNYLGSNGYQISLNMNDGMYYTATKIMLDGHLHLFSNNSTGYPWRCSATIHYVKISEEPTGGTHENY